MNTPQDLDNPALTAFALGELDDAECAAMSAWIEQHPETEEELEQIQELTNALHAYAPSFEHKLHPHQRQAVLAGPQRVRELVAAASTAQRAAQKHRQMLSVWRMAKIAAAAVIAFGAFIAGTHYERGPVGELVKIQPSPPAPQPLATASPAVSKGQASATSPTPTTTPQSANTLPVLPPQPSAVIAIAPPATQKPLPQVQISPTQHEISPPVIVASLAKINQPNPEATQTRAPHLTIFSEPFISATRDAVSSLTLRPSDTRPLPAKSKDPVLGAPLPLGLPNKPASPRSLKTPELLIHAWKAEVTTCPWDESHRLVRLVLQVPGEQPAATLADYTYPLQVAFDPNYVRSYRLLAQRATTPAAMDAAAVHVAWYEVTPNGTTLEGNARNLGRVTLPGARFTTQVTSPFDGTAMQILDRSAHWQGSRHDFLYEAALVSFGLLLKGEKDLGSLNHAMVLDLAEKSTTDDRTGERAKFVKLLKQAQQSTGL